MSNLTLGIELEMRSKSIGLHVPGIEAEQEGEPTFLYSTQQYLDPEEWNKRAVACSDVVELTLEVSFRHPERAKVEFRTPVECTQTLDRFQLSTSATLYAAHLFFYFAFKNPGGTLGKFIDFFRTACAERRYEPLEFCPRPPGKNDPRSLSEDLRFPDFDPTQLRPRFAPQLTFSAPLERVPALFSAPRGTFHEPDPAPRRGQAQQPAAAFKNGIPPRAIEQTAVLLARQFVEERLKEKGQQARLARKLTGFFSLVSHLTLTAAFRSSIDRGDVRSPRGQYGGTSKDNFRFLLRSRLDVLFRKGLSSLDRDSAKLCSAALPGELLKFLRDSLTEGFVPIYNVLEHQEKDKIIARMDPFPTSPIRKSIAQVFSSTAELPESRPFSDFIDDVAKVDQREFDVTRKVRRVEAQSSSSGAPRLAVPRRPLPPPPAVPRRPLPPRPPRYDAGYLDRPVFEYRRFIGECEGYFASAAAVADALTELYDKLRWLESEINPSHLPYEGSTSKAYYRPLKGEQLAWTTGGQPGLATLTLEKPRGNGDVESWWTSLNGRH